MGIAMGGVLEVQSGGHGGGRAAAEELEAGEQDDGLDEHDGADEHRGALQQAGGLGRLFLDLLFALGFFLGHGWFPCSRRGCAWPTGAAGAQKPP